MNRRDDSSSSSIPSDRKLIFIVKKLLEKQHKDSQQTPLSWDANSLTDLVLERHREYQRKNRVALQSSIENILNHKLYDTPASPTSVDRDSTLTGSSKNKKKKLKRKHEVDDPTLASGRTFNSQHCDMDPPPPSSIPSDLEYDQFAQQEDLLREQWIGSSMLNAGLRSRYMNMQRERDAATESRPATPGDTDAVDANTNVHATDKDPLGANTSTVQSDVPTAIAPKKTKKKRVSMPAEQIPPSSSSSLFTPTPRPKERYSDLGGMSNILTQIRQLIEYPLMHPELFQHLGIDPPRGILLRGPPGTVSFIYA